MRRPSVWAGCPFLVSCFFLFKKKRRKQETRKTPNILCCVVRHDQQHRQCSAGKRANPREPKEGEKVGRRRRQTTSAAHDQYRRPGKEGVSAKAIGGSRRSSKAKQTGPAKNPRYSLPRSHSDRLSILEDRKIGSTPHTEP